MCNQCQVYKSNLSKSDETVFEIVLRKKRIPVGMHRAIDLHSILIHLIKKNVVFKRNTATTLHDDLLSTEVL